MVNKVCFNCVNINNKLADYFEGKQPMSFTINCDVFDEIIGEIMLNNYYEELATTHQWSLEIFNLLHHTNSNNNIEDHYINTEA